VRNASGGAVTATARKPRSSSPRAFECVRSREQSARFTLLSGPLRSSTPASNNRVRGQAIRFADEPLSNRSARCQNRQNRVYNVRPAFLHSFIYSGTVFGGEISERGRPAGTRTSAGGAVWEIYLPKQVKKTKQNKLL